MDELEKRSEFWSSAWAQSRAVDVASIPLERLGRAEAAAIADHANVPEVALQIRQQSSILAYCLTKLSLVHREGHRSRLLPWTVDSRSW